MNKPKVNSDVCIGCGTCVSMCPDVFEFKDDKAQVIKNVDHIKNEKCIKEAKEACPVQAIG